MQLGAARVGRRVENLLARFKDRFQGIPVRRVAEANGLPVPPAQMLHLIGASENPSWFLRSGKWAAEDVCALVGKYVGRMEELGAVLDFGCGVGRVIRHWQDWVLAGIDVVGTDYNPKLIGWCRENLPFARFLHNELDGIIDAPNHHFGLVYAFSVFTHLSEQRQRHWMVELNRVIRPGGFLLLTLHGDSYRSTLSESLQTIYDRGEIVVIGSDHEGSNDCAAFHPPQSVPTDLARNWEILEVIPSGSRSNPTQDIYLLRKQI